MRLLEEDAHNRAIKEALEDGFNEDIEVHDTNNDPNINVKNAANAVNSLVGLLGLEVNPVDKKGPYLESSTQTKVFWSPIATLLFNLLPGLG